MGGNELIAGGGLETQQADTCDECLATPCVELSQTAPGKPSAEIGRGNVALLYDMKTYVRSF